MLKNLKLLTALVVLGLMTAPALAQQRGVGNGAIGNLTTRIESLDARLADVEYSLNSTGPTGVVVVDSNLTEVGMVVGTPSISGELAISLFIDDHFLILKINNREVFGTRELIFEDSECFGPPLMVPAPAEALTPSVGVGGPPDDIKGNIVYIPDPDAEPFTPLGNDTGARYKLQAGYDGSISGVTDRETGWSIPNAQGNRHWQQYLDWVAAGNEPSPPGGPLFVGDGEICRDYPLRAVVPALELGDMDELFVSPYRIMPARP